MLVLMASMHDVIMIIASMHNRETPCMPVVLWVGPVVLIPVQHFLQRRMSLSGGVFCCSSLLIVCLYSSFNDASE